MCIITLVLKKNAIFSPNITNFAEKIAENCAHNIDLWMIFLVNGERILAQFSNKKNHP
jgi:hypothetical protein